MEYVSQKNGEARLDSFFRALEDELKPVCSTEGRQNPAVDRLYMRMRKRAMYDRPSLESSAIAKFKAINEEVSQFVLGLPDDIVSNARHFITVMLERFTARLGPLNIQETFDDSFLFDNWRFGPGASNGIKGTHAAEKIAQEMTVTSSCAHLVQKLRTGNYYFSSFDRANGGSGYRVVDGSRLTTVPKNEDTVRTIAVEPSGNMCLQLAAGRYLEGVLAMIGCDITKQAPKNKELARRGSVNGDLATIDLASASDRISLQLVRALMPHKWVVLLETLRSPCIQLPKEDKALELHMVSTMGNGFTFPLMTLLLVSLIYACRCRRPSNPTLYVDWSSTAVFGDDIIVPVDEYAGLCEVLNQAGFVVNHDKSYCDGPFRESCGGDYYEGLDVTPFYVKSLRCESEVYVALNQVLEWSAKHRILLWKSLAVLRTFVDRVLLVPEWHSPDEGVLTAQCGRRYKYLKQKVQLKRLRGNMELFAMPLACGGYIEARSLDLFFSPRPFKNVRRIKASRIPNGYLDGADRVKRPAGISDYIASYTFLLN